MKQVRILLADDDRVILAMLAEDLIAHGYQVQTAANGAEAVEACRLNPPDLAILDIRMPVMSGIDAAHILREECGAPILFLSAYSDKELVEQAVRLVDQTDDRVGRDLGVQLLHRGPIGRRGPIGPISAIEYDAFPIIRFSACPSHRPRRQSFLPC